MISEIWYKMMANAMVETRYEAGAYRRVELITGRRRRRDWTVDEKARIITNASCLPGRQRRECQRFRVRGFRDRLVSSTIIRLRLAIDCRTG